MKRKNTVKTAALRKAARKSTLKVGDEVRFLPMGGIWAELSGLDGIIVKKNKDPMWRYEVEIHQPHLLSPDGNFLTAGNRFIACVSPSALIKIGKVGVDTHIHEFHPRASKLVALRLLRKKLLEMDKRELQFQRKYGTKNGIRLAKKMISNDRNMIAELTEDLQILKDLGFREPPEYTLKVRNAR